MSGLNEEKIKELINEIRGTTSEDTLATGVKAMIKEDAEKAQAKLDEDKKLIEKVKSASDKIKTDDTDVPPPEPPKRDETGKFVKTEPDPPAKDEDKDSAEEDKIKELTGQMAEMLKEIDALKKRKNYRMKPPPAEEVEEVDDFIKQNITKDFEVVV